ncbi:MAG: GNAT family N-acetyltransferase [Thermoplasmata archaeon]
MRAEKIPVLILSDSPGPSWLSLEAVREKDGFFRLFKEFSDPTFKISKEILARLDGFLSNLGARSVRFEDNKAGTLCSIMTRLRYCAVDPYRSSENIKTRARFGPSDADPRDTTYFGVGDEAKLAVGEKVRRIDVFENEAMIGSLILSDYGRFARARANRFGSEGFGLVVKGNEPSKILLAAAMQLHREGKRYMILGGEYAPYVDPIHPFPLWHMKLSGQKEFEHGCRVAGKQDVEFLSRLTCEYEDTDIVSATSTVLKNLGSPEFEYLVPPCGNGFALLKFVGNSEGMIHDLYVSPIDQGKGIGNEMTRGAISVLSEDCLTIHLNTIYPRAKKLYEKHGFEVEYTDYCVALNQTAMSRS